LILEALSKKLKLTTTLNTLSLVIAIMAKPAANRLMHDLKEAAKLESDEIYIDFDESDMRTVYALVMGPEDTPYQHGFFLFTITLPENYPFNHPSAKFLTTKSGVRFHPNYYEDGKICLSILGTWGQLSWTPSQTLSAVLISFQSIMTTNPVINEPGYESTDPESEKGQAYSKYVEYHVMSYAFFDIGKNYKNLKWIRPAFHETIERIYQSKKEKMLSRVKELVQSPDQGRSLHVDYGHRKVLLDYQQILDSY
jgi:ubiquitin-protein ligase